MQGGIEGRAEADFLFPVKFDRGRTTWRLRATRTKFRTRQDTAEGAARHRGLFQLVRPHEARRGVQGPRPHLGADRLPALLDQRPLSRPRSPNCGSRKSPTCCKIEIVVRTATRAGPRRPSKTNRAACASRPGQPQTALGSGTAADGRAEPRGARAGTAARAPNSRQSVLGSPLDPRYTFDSFVEGPSNRVALAAARAVAEVQSSCASTRSSSMPPSASARPTCCRRSRRNR